MKSRYDLTRVLITDCGSTTTKGLLFERTVEGWRHTARGEAPTTVEEPVADVTVGVRNACAEIEELRGIRILSESSQEPPFREKGAGSEDQEGIDLYLSTSSAGGGLQMVVSGVVRQMTAQSAERAALGAGAIVLDVVSADDGREDFERVERIRHLKPDIFLLTGGVDGGARTHVIEAAEILRAAAPRPRFGDTLKLPVIYAGNQDAAEEVLQILSPIAQVTVVENIRPSLEEEHLAPAREAIHDFFLSHVMSHSPGYAKLLSWTPVPVMPTPAAVGDMVQAYARRNSLSVLCADIGGATTDVFSVFPNGEGGTSFNRTVSANYGMSYSMANVLVEAGAPQILRWLPYEISESEMRDRLRNKMIRPTSIPQTLEDLWLEQAVCREALRLSLEHHRSLATGLKGVRRGKGIADIFTQNDADRGLVDLMKLDVVIGSGGVLSHAPHRLEAALMMLDGFGLAGVTHLTVDSIFMMPHLGILSTVHPEAAEEIFTRDCLVSIAHSIVPVYPTRLGVGSLAEVVIDGVVQGVVERDGVTRVSLPVATSFLLEVRPGHSRIDVGDGPGKIVTRQIVSGSHGLILDGRNRPMVFSSDLRGQIASQRAVLSALDIFEKGEGP